MNYVVLDLEFNQPFNFSKNAKGVADANIPFEIIQIGAVKLDENFELSDKFNAMIKPVVYKRLHPYVKKITGFSSNDFKDGVTFQQAFEELVNFCGKSDCAICVWGDNDIKLLYKNTTFYKLDPLLLPKKYINIQTLAGTFLKEPSGKLIGLKNAIDKLELPVDASFHDAYNDALYTSYILKKLKNNDFNIATYKTPSLRKKSFANDFKTDLIKLYAYAEKEYGRKLSRKEKTLIKNVYDFGLKKEFELME